MEGKDNLEKKAEDEGPRIEELKASNKQLTRTLVMSDRERCSYKGGFFGAAIGFAISTGIAVYNCVSDSNISDNIFPVAIGFGSAVGGYMGNKIHEKGLKKYYDMVNEADLKAYNDRVNGAVLK